MGLRSRKRGDCRACCAEDLQCTLAGSSATPSVAVGVWCDRAEKSSLISQRLPLPLNLSPPSRLPSLLARCLSRSLSLLSQGVLVLECSWSSFGNLDPEPVYTHIPAHTRAYTRAHTCTRAGTHALRFSPRGHGSDLHLPEVDAPAGHFFTCLLRRAEAQHRDVGGSLSSLQPHAFYRHHRLKCPRWRKASPGRMLRGRGTSSGWLTPVLPSVPWSILSSPAAGWKAPAPSGLPPPQLSLRAHPTQKTKRCRSAGSWAKP